MKNRFIFITGNKNKFDEASKIIRDITWKDIDLVEIQSLDPEEIIKAKLDEAKKHISENIIVEDGGLYIDSLNGLPGPLIKWFMKSLDNEGLYKLVASLKNKHAEAKVMIGVTFGEKKIKFFEGSIQGQIVSPRGENGFGWDKIFEPKGFDKTFAEMTTEEKNEISMRKIAFIKFAEYLKNEKS